MTFLQDWKIRNKILVAPAIMAYYHDIVGCCLSAAAL